MKKIGIFGGTFDPIHRGHLQVAQEFAVAMGLDRVLMMVAATPPHRDPPAASPEDRLEMAKLAVKGYPNLTASDMELVRAGPSFTMDTLNDVRKAAGVSKVWMALGVDAYELIHSWRNPVEVLAGAHLVVLTRPGYRIDLLSPLPDSISSSYHLEGDVYVRDGGGTLRTLQVSPVDISSSMIRSAVSRGENIRGLVTEEVLQYIRQKGLYRPVKPTGGMKKV